MPVNETEYEDDARVAEEHGNPVATPEDSERERVIANLFQTVPELSEACKDGTSDITATFAMAAMARLACANPTEYLWEIHLLGDVLRQRIQAGYLGDTKAMSERRNSADALVFTELLRFKFKADPGQEVLKKIQSRGFYWHPGEECWVAPATPERRGFWEGLHVEQGTLLTKGA